MKLDNDIILSENANLRRRMGELESKMDEMHQSKAKLEGDKSKRPRPWRRGLTDDENSRPDKSVKL